MKKRVLSLLLVLCVLLAMVPALSQEAKAAQPTEAQFAAKINELRGIYKNGEYWNEYNGFDRTGTTICPSCSGRNSCAATCSDKCGKFYYNGTKLGGQCAGFAMKLFYLVFGVPPQTDYGNQKLNSVSGYYAGDYVRINSNTHSIFVTKVDGDTVYYVDCNWAGPCKVKWDNTISTSSLKGKTSYVLRYPGNTLSGTGGTPGPAPTQQPSQLDRNFDGFYPIQSYAVSTGQVAVYDAVNGTKYSKRYIDGKNDVCKILQVYTNGWCYVSYPSSAEPDGWFEAYVPTKEFMPNVNTSRWTADKNYPAYRRTDKNGTIGTVYGNDNCLVVGSSGGLTQVIYPITGGSKMGWVEKSVIHVHSYTHTVTNPTCTAQGYTTHKCACGHSYVDSYKDALGHNMSGSVTKQPTCTADGVKTFKCSRCSHQYTEAVAKLGHSYGKTVTNPTCDAQGYTTYTCSRCSHSYKDNYTGALGHKWNGGVVTKAATCEADGVKTYTCRNNASHTKTESIPKLGHKEVKLDGKAATCTEAGLSEGSKCSVCNKVLKAQTEIPALGHDYDEGKVTKEAACEADGVKTYTCKRDASHTKTESIPALGHKEVKLDGKAATCTEAGLSEGSKCSVCGKVLKEQTEIPALGHKDENEDGLCDVCKEKLTEALRGDMDGNGRLNSDDAIYLLCHTMLPEDYPISQKADMDGNGRINSDDAIYLLCHTMLPDDYPLSK